MLGGPYKEPAIKLLACVRTLWNRGYMYKGRARADVHVCTKTKEQKEKNNVSIVYNYDARF